MILELAITLSLLLGGASADTTGPAAGQGDTPAAMSSEQPPPPDTDIRAHVIEIG